MDLRERAELRPTRPTPGDPSPKKRKPAAPMRPLSAGQAELVARYLPLARKVSRPFRDAWPRWRDELESEAALALMHAAVDYDPSRGGFGPFARFLIRGELGRLIARLLRGEASEVAGEGRPRPNDPSRFLGLARGGEGAVDRADAAEHWLRKLPGKHAHLCRLHYLEGRTHREIAEARGCSRREVTRLVAQAIELLQGEAA